MRGDFLIFLRIPIVAGAALLMAGAMVLLGMPLATPLSVHLLLLATLLIAAVYSFNTFTDFEEDAVNSPAFAEANSRSRRSVLAFSLACGAASFVLSLFLGATPALITGAILLTGFLYSYPMLGRMGIPRLKEVFVLKNLIIASWWMMITVLAAAVRGRPLDVETPFLFGFIFIQIFIESVVRDAHDRRGDAAAGLSTIPSRIGLRRTLILLLALNTVSALLVIAATVTASYPFLLLLGCAWMYFVLVLLLEERPLRMTFANVNYPVYLLLFLGAFLGRLIF